MFLGVCKVLSIAIVCSILFSGCSGETEVKDEKYFDEKEYLSGCSAKDDLKNYFPSKITRYLFYDKKCMKNHPLPKFAELTSFIEGSFYTKEWSYSTPIAVIFDDNRSSSDRRINFVNIPELNIAPALKDAKTLVIIIMTSNWRGEDKWEQNATVKIYDMPNGWDLNTISSYPDEYKASKTSDRENFQERRDELYKETVEYIASLKMVSAEESTMATFRRNSAMICDENGLQQPIANIINSLEIPKPTTKRMNLSSQGYSITDVHAAISNKKVPDKNSRSAFKDYFQGEENWYKVNSEGSFDFYLDLILPAMYNAEMNDRGLIVFFLFDEKIADGYYTERGNSQNRVQAYKFVRNVFVVDIQKQKIVASQKVITDPEMTIYNMETASKERKVDVRSRTESLF